ncbi:MAG: tryptophan-rich sensory protein [Gammaproteobacteria bacterium]
MRKYIPLFATLVVIVVNAAANIVPINGVRTGELSALYPTGFTPAGWVFAIWSVIYAGLLAFSVYAMRVAPDEAPRVSRVVTPYLLSCAANALWIFMWHYEVILGSLACMLVILGSLIAVYARLYASPPTSLAQRICVDMPFSLYLGWITTATLANLAAWFFDIHVYPFDLARDEWAIITVVTATAIYTAVGVRTRDAIYTAVFAWASLGIVLQTLETVRSVRLAAAAGCVVAGVVTAVALVQGRKYRRPGSPASAPVH